MKRTISSPVLIRSILVIYVVLAVLPPLGAAQENLIKNGDFSQGLEDWSPGMAPHNCPPYPPANDYEYSCAKVTEQGTPGNPHLELYVGVRKFEADVSQTLSPPKEAGRITLSLRVWSLGNSSYVRTLIVTDTEPQNVTRLEDLYEVHRDWYESFYYPSGEPTTITRDVTNFHDPTTYLLVGGNRVAVDDITIVATPPSPEPLYMQRLELVKNGGFSQDLHYWQCCGKISKEGASGNPYLELVGTQVSQELHLPEDADGISLSIRAWALALQSPEHVIPYVEIRVSYDYGKMGQETYSVLKPALRMEPAIIVTRDLTGFKGKTVTLTIEGEEAAVDDVAVLATWSSSGFPITFFHMILAIAIIVAASLGEFLALRRRHRIRDYEKASLHQRST